MTREEAVEIINDVISEGWLGSVFDTDACKMAIEALKQEPCEDAISREEAKKAMFDLCGDGSLKENPWRDNPNIDAIIDALDNMPPVTPKQKTGYWIENAPEYQNIDPPYICSECGHSNLIKTNYCEQCGAKMEREYKE